MSDETPHVEHTPGCCQRPADTSTHPNWLAWLESARALMAGGVPEDKIKAFDGQPVAVQVSE